MHRTFTWVIILLIATGCNLSSLEDTVVVPDVDDEFYLDYREVLTADGRFLEFRLRTIANEPCSNASINHDFRQSNRELSISIKEIFRPEGCEPGEAPATAVIRTYTPLPGGYYPLFVDLRGTVTSDGQVVVTSEAYTISLDKGRGIVLLRPELLRIPDETIWGYIYYEDEAMAPVADELTSRLQAISKARVLRDGYYGYFTMDKGALQFNDNTAPNGARAFSYWYDGDKDALVELLEEYRANYGGSLEAKLFNTLGEAF